MLIKELYKKNIERDLNPAVSAEDFSSSTIETEISEYVFTDDIINGLYSVLSSIMKHNVSHNGIWINGFFGSGKSHFLKYLGYCTNPQYREAALARFEEAVRERDPLQCQESRSEVTVADFNTLASWIRRATVDIVLFNIGSVHDANTTENQVFTQIFWNQFNKFRGYNSEKLAMAQHLEKLLDQNGQFDAFKQRLADEGFDWSTQASILSVAYLDHLMDIAKELLPFISADAIKIAIVRDRENVSPAAFCHELKEFVTAKNNPHYRLLFLVDEVSQFIGANQQLLLQLQEVVTGLCNECGDKAWLACTAQQDLSEFLTNMQIHATSNDYGRIMGRFEVRVSLKGNQTEFITQKRLLDKNEAAQNELHELYDRKHLAIGNQFILPLSFNSFENKEDFTAYYPFVPYQFRLMRMVLDSFGQLGYIDIQSKGNERSVIKITHSTAQTNINDEVNNFISFDRFYNSMFAGSLKQIGQNAIRNAENMVRQYREDEAFARRIVNILFMICNLKDGDKLLFPATLDYIVTLLMQDVDANRQELITRAEKALAFLREKHIIRIETNAETGVSTYCFQSEDEIDAEREIEAIQVDNAMMAERYREVFSRHFKAHSNREHYCSKDFSIGWTIYGRNSLANNPDILVDFLLSGPSSDTLFGASNDAKKLTFNIWSGLQRDRQLQNDFFYYCQVQQFVSQPSRSEVRARTISSINERVKSLYNNSIVPKLHSVLNRCEIKSGNTIINVDGDGAVRYKRALEMHLSNVYEYARLAVSPSIPTSPSELQQAILRPIQPGEYGPLNPITQAESLLEQHIANQFGTVYVSEMFRVFGERPYGWSNIATAYYLNELRRRQIRSFTYNSDPTVDNATIAQNLLNCGKMFTIIQAASISRELINDFIRAWRNIFNTSQMTSSFDSSELFRMCKEGRPGEAYPSIAEAISRAEETKGALYGLPLYNELDPQLDLLREWKGERDHQRFFERVVEDEIVAKELFDKGKAIRQFVTDMLKPYKEIRTFVIDNEDNFSFITDQNKVEELKTILYDHWPIPNMRKYGQIRNELDRALNAKINSIRDEIKYGYVSVFEELRSFAEENQVEYRIDETSVLAVKTSSNNLYRLQNELDTSTYRSQQIEEMMRRRPTPPTTDNTPRRKVRMVSIKTGSTFPVNTESDVDKYLALLRKQLMTQISSRGENEDIMVK